MSTKDYRFKARLGEGAFRSNTFPKRVLILLRQMYKIYCAWTSNTIYLLFSFGSNWHVPFTLMKCFQFLLLYLMQRKHLIRLSNRVLGYVVYVWMFQNDCCGVALWEKGHILIVDCTNSSFYQAWLSPFFYMLNNE